MQVSLHLDRLSDIGTQDLKQVLVQFTRPGKVHDRYVDAFLIDLAGVRAEAAAAHVDDVDRVREQPHCAALVEGGGNHRDVVIVTHRQPGVVGDVRIARRH